MTTIYSVYDQVAELLASLEPAKILAMKANPELQTRLDFLVEKSKNQSLTKQEKDELDHYIVLERLIRLAKIRSHS
jgi:uncharacterized protein YnzC (UPF0291/DUF896 family)